MQYEGILDTNLFLRYLHDGTEEEKEKFREIVESIFSLPVEVENFEVILKALALYEEKNLKFGDALVLAYAQVRRIKPIYTFDSDFEKFSEAKVL